MAAYGRGKSRATKKRAAKGAAEPEVKKPRKRVTGKSPATEKRGAKRPAKKTGAKRATAAARPKTKPKRGSSPRGKTSREAKRTAPTRRKVAKPKAKPAKPTSKTARKPTKKTVRKSAAVRAVKGTRKSSAKPKPKARTKVAPKKAPSRARKAPSKAPPKVKRVRAPQKGTALAKARAEAKRLRAKLDRLEKARQKARRTGAKKPKPKTTKGKVRSELKKAEKQRNETLVKAEALRQGADAKTSKQKKNLAAELFDRRRPKFMKMLDHAKRTNQLPEVDYRKRRIDSMRNQGEQRTLRIERLVTETSVEPIVDKVRWAVESMSHAFGIWQAVIVMAGLGERLIGYGQRTLTMNDVDAAAFQTEGIESTGVWNSPAQMIAKVEEILTDYASEQYTVIYCQHIRVMNISRKQGW